MTTKTRFTTTTTLVLMKCGSCGIPFGLNEQHYNAADHDYSVSWYCPGCGSYRHFIGQTSEERLREQLDRAYSAQADTRQQLAAERRQHAATKGSVTKLKKRVAAGVCPCCTRTFQNLQRHMANQHPEYPSA